MRSRSRTRHTRTEGERSRALAFFLIGVFGAGMGLLAVTQLSHGAFFSRRMTPYEWYVVVVSAVGAKAALFLAGDRLGQPGLSGYLRGLAGGVWVSFVGALIAGTLALPVYGTMFGPFTLAVTLAGAPMLMGFWLAQLTALHVLMGIWQRERDSIFDPDRTDPFGGPDRLPARIRGRVS